MARLLLLVLYVCIATSTATISDGVVAMIQGIPNLAQQGWNISSPQSICDGTWEGVQCIFTTVGSVSKEVPYAVTFRDIQLGGYLKDGIGAIGLQRLTLSNAKLTGTIPGDLFSVNTLRILRLEDNQLSGNIPDSLGQATMLQELYLSRNRLTRATQLNLAPLTELKTLQIGGNMLNASSISNMDKLTELTIFSSVGNTYPICPYRTSGRPTVCATDAYRECGCNDNLCNKHPTCGSYATATTPLYYLSMCILLLLYLNM